MRKNIHLIAEIGINHNGDINIAKKLIDNSKKSGFEMKIGGQVFDFTKN